MNKKILIICFFLLLIITSIVITKLILNNIEEENIKTGREENNIKNRGDNVLNSYEQYFNKANVRESGMYGIINERVFKLEKIENEYSYNEPIKGEKAKNMFEGLWNEIKMDSITVGKNSILDMTILYINDNNDTKKIVINSVFFCNEKGANGVYSNPSTILFKASKIPNAYVYKISSSDFVRNVNIFKVTNNNVTEYFGIKTANS